MLPLLCVAVLLVCSRTARSSCVSWWHRARKTIGASRVSPCIICSSPNAGGTACEGYIPAVMMILARRMNIGTLVLVVSLVKET